MKADQPCRFCGSTELERYTMDVFEGEDVPPIVLDVISCLDCRAEAPVNVWNSTPIEEKHSV